MNYKMKKRNLRIKFPGQLGTTFKQKTKTGRIVPSDQGTISMRGGFSPAFKVKPNPFTQGNVAEGVKMAAKAALSAAKGDGVEVLQKVGEKITGDLKRTVEKPVNHRKGSFELLINGQIGALKQQTVKAVGLDSLHSRVHKVKYITGKSTTKPLLDMAKQNGITKIVKFDTKAQGTSPTITRAQLSNSSGFNLRQFFMPPLLSSPSYFSLFDSIDKTAAEIIRPDGARATLLASLLDVKTDFEVFNQNFSIPMKVKIHLLHRKSPMADSELDELPPQEIRAHCLWTDPKVANPQTLPGAVEKVPTFYQETPVSSTGNISTQSIQWEHSLKGKGLLDSAYFRQNYQIVKTIQRTLKPSDLMRFSHIHRFGGGVDINKAIMWNDLDPTGQGINLNTPLHGYYYLFEVSGAQNVEIAYQKDATTFEPYIGIAPSFYFVDFRSTMRYVRGSSNPIISTAGVNIDPVQIRVFVDDPADGFSDAIRTEFRVRSENIAQSSTAGMGIGKAHIVSITDSTASSSMTNINSTKDND
jgi:hypothetical protein